VRQQYSREEQKIEEKSVCVCFRSVEVTLKKRKRPHLINTTSTGVWTRVTGPAAMAGITGHVLTIILLLFSILATGGLESVAAAAAAYYRPQFFAIQNRHFGPHSVTIAITKFKDQALLTWIHGLNPRMMSSTPETEKQFFRIVPSRPNKKHCSLLSSRKLPMPLVSRSPFPVKVVERLNAGPGGQEANFTSNGIIYPQRKIAHDHHGP
jgi:hypothetical protein